MSSPVLGRTSSLYTDDAGYQALADYVDAFDSGTGRSGEPTAHAIGDEVTLTWLIHDVSVWRVDRVYADATGGPWIATQEAVGGTTDIWSAPVRWHRSDQPKALMALLAAHGLTDGSQLPAGSVGDVTAGDDVVAGSDASTGSGVDEPERPARADHADRAVGHLAVGHAARRPPPRVGGHRGRRGRPGPPPGACRGRCGAGPGVGGRRPAHQRALRTRPAPGRTSSGRSR